MYQAISKIGSFEAAHRLLNHPGKCSSVHGHSYRWKLTLHLLEPHTSEQIIIDYGDISTIFKGYVDTYLDHCCLCNPADKELESFLLSQESKLYYMSLDNHTCLTSAENLAKELFLSAQLLFDEAEEVQVASIELAETKKNSTVVTAQAIYAEEREQFTLAKQLLIKEYITNLEV